MKICVAQTKPVKRDIQTNIKNHKRLIDLAIVNGAKAVFFPELSITGYEPKLSKELAANQDDKRFEVFQKICDTKQITVGVGMPTKNDSGVLISMIIFQPHSLRQTYSKHYLHSDELPYFVNGQYPMVLKLNDHKISIAICYELSVPEHSKNAFKEGSEIYIASVAKSVEGVQKAIQTLSETASKYSMMVLMSNCVGHCDDFECGGKTSIWNNKGLLSGQLNDSSEGILIIDTDTMDMIEKTID